MKKIWKYFFLLLCTPVSAQNLVPNYSFEQHDTCPDDQDQIQRATGWSKYSYVGSTPDYYNVCDTGGFYGIPSVSFHHGAHTGNAFAGIVTYVANFIYIEHIGIQLIQPLNIGQKYFLSFYTTLGYGTASITPSNNIGIRLSTTAYSSSNPSPLVNFAHLNSTAIITDTVNWIHVSGSFIADSAYAYCIIGNFFDKANTDTIRWSTISNASYYGIDDVCISTDSLTCNPNLEGIANYDRDILSVYPNPTDGIFFIALPENSLCELIVYNELGYEIIHKALLEQVSEIDLRDYSRGIYFVKVEISNATIVRKVILI